MDTCAKESPALVKSLTRLADCHGRLSIDHGFNYLGSLRCLPRHGVGETRYVCRLVREAPSGRGWTEINLDVRQRRAYLTACSRMRTVPGPLVPNHEGHHSNEWN
jgi:hypothetical protein